MDTIIEQLTDIIERLKQKNASKSDPSKDSILPLINFLERHLDPKFGNEYLEQLAETLKRRNAEIDALMHTEQQMASTIRELNQGLSASMRNEQELTVIIENLRQELAVSLQEKEALAHNEQQLRANIERLEKELASRSRLADGSFRDNKDGTVTDTATGLMWQQTGATSKKKWKDALSYCKNLSLAGYTDWRLPTIEELRSLVDHSHQKPSINTTYFPNAISSFYWSSTTYADYTSHAWGVYFSYGSGYFNYKNSDYDVRAVRGGQS